MGARKPWVKAENEFSPEGAKEERVSPPVPRAGSPASPVLACWGGTSVVQFLSWPDHHPPGVIPKPRVFTSEARDLARITHRLARSAHALIFLDSTTTDGAPPLSWPDHHPPGVIPKPRIFTSEARDLARTTHRLARPGPRPSASGR